MDDLISRQAAIRWVKTECNPYGNPTLDYESGNKVMEHLEQMPSAQPQRMRGRWMPEFNGRFTGGAYWFSCSRCKRIVPDVRNGGWNFCPECGADMREGQE